VKSSQCPKLNYAQFRCGQRCALFVWNHSIFRFGFGNWREPNGDIRAMFVIITELLIVESQGFLVGRGVERIVNMNEWIFAPPKGCSTINYLTAVCQVDKNG